MSQSTIRNRNLIVNVQVMGEEVFLMFFIESNTNNCINGGISARDGSFASAEKLTKPRHVKKQSLPRMLIQLIVILENLNKNSIAESIQHLKSVSKIKVTKIFTCILNLII